MFETTVSEGKHGSMLASARFARGLVCVLGLLVAAGAAVQPAGLPVATPGVELCGPGQRGHQQCGGRTGAHHIGIGGDAIRIRCSIVLCEPSMIGGHFSQGDSKSVSIKGVEI